MVSDMDTDLAEVLVSPRSSGSGKTREYGKQDNNQTIPTTDLLFSDKTM